MKRSWNTLSQMSNGIYAVADFERVAYRNLTAGIVALHRGIKPIVAT